MTLPACCGGASRPTCRRRPSTSSAPARSTATRVLPPDPDHDRAAAHATSATPSGTCATPSAGRAHPPGLGLRHTRIESTRPRQRVDGVPAALHYALAGRSATSSASARLVYASCGQGVESTGHAQPRGRVREPERSAAGAEVPAVGARRQGRRRPVRLAAGRVPHQAAHDQLDFCSRTRGLCTARGRWPGAPSRRGSRRASGRTARGAGRQRDAAATPSAKAARSSRPTTAEAHQRARRSAARAGGLPVPAVPGLDSRAASRTRARAPCWPTSRSCCRPGPARLPRCATTQRSASTRDAPGRLGIDNVDRPSATGTNRPSSSAMSTCIPRRAAHVSRSRVLTAAL